MYVRWKDKSSGKYLVVQFDAVMREGLESDIDITTHPVEQGSDITDHAHDKPEKLTVEGYVSNKPLPSNPGVLGFKGDLRFTPESSLSIQTIPLISQNPLLLEDRTLLTDLGEPKPGILDRAAGFTPGALTQKIVGAVNNFFNPPPTSATVYLGAEDFADRAKATYAKLRTAQRERALCEVGFKMITLSDMLIAKISAPRGKGDSAGATFTLDFQRIRIVKSATVDAPKPIQGRSQPPVQKGAVAKTEEEKEEETESAAYKAHHWITGPAK